MKETKACCGFGHREVFENISNELDNAIAQAVELGCKTFYTGAMGKFDMLFSSAVRKVKKKHPDIMLICVKPYMTKEINENHIYYSGLYYDDIIIPTELTGIHYKAAIKKRNHWIVNHSDLVIIYAVRKYGGAYNALRYSIENSKAVIRLEKSNDEKTNLIISVNYSNTYIF